MFLQKIPLFFVLTRSVITYSYCFCAFIGFSFLGIFFVHDVLRVSSGLLNLGHTVIWVLLLSHDSCAMLVHRVGYFIGNSRVA